MYLYKERMYMCICIYECMNMYLWKTRSFSYLIFDSSLFENKIVTWDHGSLLIYAPLLPTLSVPLP